MQSVAKRRKPQPGTPPGPGETAAAKDALNAAIEVFHRRWVLRVLWELRRGPMSFRALQEACGNLSPTVLSQRLRELRDVNLVSHEPGSGYALTFWGQELLVAMQPMVSWAVRWQRSMAR